MKNATRARKVCGVGFLLSTLGEFGGEALNGQDILAMGTIGRVHAGEHRLPIDEHRACTALRFLASDLRAREAEAMAKEGRERLPRDGWHLVVFAVDCKSNRCIHHLHHYSV